MPIKIVPEKEMPAGGPDVSVVIPTFERPTMLREAIKGVYAQTHNGTAEILVVNDSPCERIAGRLAKEFPAVRVVAEGAAGGATCARNLALEAARGAAVAFLDDDDVWEPDYLKVQLAALSGSDDAFAVSGVVIWNMLNGTRRVSSQEPDLQRYRSVAHQIVVANFIRCPSSVVFPRSTVEKAGRFDEKFPIGEDYDLYLRCLLLGCRPVFTKAPLVIRRQHGHQMTSPSNQDRRNAGRLRRVRKYHPLIRKRFAIATLREVLAETHAKFAARYFRNRRYGRCLAAFLVSLAHFSPRNTFRRFPQALDREASA